MDANSNVNVNRRMGRNAHLEGNVGSQRLFFASAIRRKGMKNRLDRDCVLLDGKCDCWIPMKECKYLPVNVNETEKQVTLYPAANRRITKEVGDRLHGCP
jgi:hypothetical protein